MKIHEFTNTGTAYDSVQHGVASDGSKIEPGDILIIDNDTEKVVAIADTWPFAVTSDGGGFLSLVEGGAVPHDIRKKFGPHMLRAIGQAVLRGWPVREEFMALPTKVLSLRCACCGMEHRGRQWGNRDEGYGLCEYCIDDCVPDPNEFLTPGCAYGVPGIHYDIDGTHWRQKNGTPT